MTRSQNMKLYIEDKIFALTCIILIYCIIQINICKYVTVACLWKTNDKIIKIGETRLIPGTWGVLGKDSILPYICSTEFNEYMY